MRYFLFSFILSIVLFKTSFAQVSDSAQFKTVYDTTRPHYVGIHDTAHIGKTKAFVAVRIGFWLGGDAGVDFSSSKTSGQQTVSHTSGFGADIQYTGWLGNYFYWDMSLSGWYVANDTKYDVQTVNDTDRTTWSLIIPFTVGGSYYFPTDIVLKPYVQAGIGAIAGYSARTEDVRKENAFENLHWKDQKTQVIVGGYIGAGTKFALTTTFGLDLSLKYMLGSFSDPLYTGVKSLSGLQVTIGIALILPFQPKF